MHYAVLHSYAWSIASYHGKLDFSHTHIQGLALWPNAYSLLLTKDSIRRLCVSFTIILDNLITVLILGKIFEKFRQVCGKYREYFEKC